MEPCLLTYLRIMSENGPFSEDARDYLCQFHDDPDFLSQARIAVGAKEDADWRREEMIEAKRPKRWRWWRTAKDRIITEKRLERLLWLMRQHGCYHERVMAHVAKYATTDPVFAREWATTWTLHLCFNGPEPLDLERFLRPSSAMM